MEPESSRATPTNGVYGEVLDGGGDGNEQVSPSPKPRRSGLQILSTSTPIAPRPIRVAQPHTDRIPNSRGVNSVDITTVKDEVDIDALQDSILHEKGLLDSDDDEVPPPPVLEYLSLPKISLSPRIERRIRGEPSPDSLSGRGFDEYGSAMKRPRIGTYSPQPLSPRSEWRARRNNLSPVRMFTTRSDWVRQYKSLAERTRREQVEEENTDDAIFDKYQNDLQNDDQEYLDQEPNVNGNNYEYNDSYDNGDDAETPEQEVEVPRDSEFSGNSEGPELEEVDPDNDENEVLEDGSLLSSVEQQSVKESALWWLKTRNSEISQKWGSSDDQEDQVDQDEDLPEGSENDNEQTDDRLGEEQPQQNGRESAARQWLRNQEKELIRKREHERQQRVSSRNADNTDLVNKTFDTKSLVAEPKSESSQDENWSNEDWVALLDLIESIRLTESQLNLYGLPSTIKSRFPKVPELNLKLRTITMLNYLNNPDAYNHGT